MNTPRIAVLGSGAQGAGIGADLIRAGQDVTFIEQWPAHVDAIRKRGIEVRMPEGTVVTPVDRVLHLCEVAELRDSFDLVFLVMKAYDSRWATQLIAPYLADDGVVVGLQNGMSIDDIAPVVGQERTVGAVIEMASNMFEPGIVTRQNSPSTAWFAVGALTSSSRDRAVEVREVLSASGTVEVSDDIRSSKWMKLIANAGELVPSAILDLPLNSAAGIPGIRAFMEACGREAARATVASGSRIVPVFGLREDEVTEPDRYADDLLGEVMTRFSFADTLTTVLQDWRKGRHAEYAEINGHVVDVLAAHGQDAPANRRAVELARRIERGELRPGVQNVELMVTDLVELND